MKNMEIKKFKVLELNDMLETKISIPAYQRGIRWSEEQRIKLIDSMKKGYPFGCILLSETSDNEYQIIDGLQRSYTIIDFAQKPSKYFSDEFITIEYINEIANLAVDKKVISEIKADLPELLIKSVRMCKDFEALSHIQYEDIKEKIYSRWIFLKENKEIVNKNIEKIIGNFRDECEDVRENLIIYAMIFSCEKEYLPDIFERINNCGTQLTKYEIFAASWSDDKVTIKYKDLEDIVKYVKDRYDSFTNYTIEISDLNKTELLEKKEITIFDMIYGFGKKISKEYPYLFKYSEKPNDIETIGFNLINACLLQKSSNMYKLNENIKKLLKDNDKINRFLYNILQCIRDVDKVLGQVIKFKCNSRDKVNIYHTELQIVSIIASFFILKYVSYDYSDEEDNIVNIKISDEVSSDWKYKYKKKLESNNLIKRYSLDIISASWKGSGDSKLFSTITNKNYYLNSVEWIDFSRNMDSYYKSQLENRNEVYKIKAPSSTDKLILSLIYSNLFTAAQQTGADGFDIEHLMTKKLMKKIILSYNDSEFSLPISSIANICLLPEWDNRSKGEDILYDDKNYLSKVNISSVERKYSFTKESDFNFKNEKLTKEEFKNAYYNFLSKRFDKIKEKIGKNYFEDEYKNIKYEKE